jgi:hypothetical protein
MKATWFSFRNILFLIKYLVYCLLQPLFFRPSFKPGELTYTWWLMQCLPFSTPEFRAPKAVPSWCGFLKKEGSSICFTSNQHRYWISFLIFRSSHNSPISAVIHEFQLRRKSAMSVLVNAWSDVRSADRICFSPSIFVDLHFWMIAIIRRYFPHSVHWSSTHCDSFATLSGTWIYWPGVVSK